MAPICIYLFISPKIESPITRSYLRYAPCTVSTVVDTLPAPLAISPGRERILRWPIVRQSVGTVQGAYRKNARVSHVHFYDTLPGLYPK